MRLLWLFLFPLFGAFASAQSLTGLRRLSHEEVRDLVSETTVLFAANEEVVHEYHGAFDNGTAPTAYRDWDQRVIEGRIELRADQPGLVCYHYTGDYENCVYFIFDETNGRTYVEYVSTVQQQTVQVIPGDPLNLQERVQIRYEPKTEDGIF